MTSINDILVGEQKVVVETDEDEIYELDKTDQTLNPSSAALPDFVETALRERGFTISSPFPKTITVYAHDEAELYDREKISESLGLSRDHKMVEAIASLTYEVEFTVKVKDKNTWEVTHVNGHELVDPITY